MHPWYEPDVATPSVAASTCAARSTAAGADADRATGHPADQPDPADPEGLSLPAGEPLAQRAGGSFDGRMGNALLTEDCGWQS